MLLNNHRGRPLALKVNKYDKIFSKDPPTSCLA
jgi:hypothetical protein